MSKCEVWFEFDQAERRYYPGETISGMVHVRVNKDCTCKKIFLRMEWRTHGKGNRNRGGKQEFAFVENAALTAGEDHSFPFMFSAPNGPLSYHGELINIDWYLTAAVDIPWARDPKAEEEFLLVGTTVFPEVPLPELDPRIENESVGLDGAKPRQSTVPLWLIVVAVIGLGLTFFTILLPIIRGSSPGLPGMLAFAIVPGLLIVGGVLASLWFSKQAAEKVGGCVVDVARPHLRPGEIVACTVRFAPPRPEVIEGVHCVLRGREVAVSGSGTNESTYRHLLHEQQQRLPGPFPANPHEEIELAFAMRVPADAPTTFEQPSNKIVWELQTVVEIAKWPNHRETETLRVAADP